MTEIKTDNESILENQLEREGLKLGFILRAYIYDDVIKAPSIAIRSSCDYSLPEFTNSDIMKGKKTLIDILVEEKAVEKIKEAVEKEETKEEK